MATKFNFSPLPLTISYQDIAGGNHPDGKDTWITAADLKVGKHHVSVPAQYKDEMLAGRVLSVKGVPFGVTSNVFRDMFMPFGKVNKSPVLICLGSQETFRWVIMKHADDAQDVMRALDGSTHESGSKLIINRGMVPGEVAELALGNQLSNENISRQNNAESHGHPSISAVQPSKSLLAPIPKVAVPVIPPPGLHGGPVSLPLPGFAARPVPQHPVGTPSQQPPIVRPAAKIPIPRETPSLSSAASGDSIVKAKSPALESAVESSASQPSSWANIASSSDPDTRVIELRSEYKSNSAAPRLNPLGRIPTVVHSRDDVPEESPEEQLRLIFLLNLPNNIGLQEITQAISEGPLVRIQFGHDNDTNARYVGIIFQYAEHAEAFYNVLIKERERSRPERFRFIVDVVRGEAVPADEVIRSMNEHPYATRRLTIVKGKFFFMFGERQLKDMCVKIAGEDNVQLVWLYNGGNATVVFADAESAIKVKRILDQRANASTNGEQGAEPIVWKGLQTTFSKDPCIHPLDLKTAMHD